MKKALLLIIAAPILASCAHQRQIVTVPVVHDSVQVRTEIRVDSVWRDRWRTEYMRGDTLRILDSVIVESFKWRERHDTLVVRDSVPVVRDVPGPVEYRRTKYDKTVSWLFWILVGLGMLRIAWRIVKKYYLKM